MIGFQAESSSQRGPPGKSFPAKKKKKKSRFSFISKIAFSAVLSHSEKNVAGLLRWWEPSCLLEFPVRSETVFVACVAAVQRVVGKESWRQFKVIGRVETRRVQKKANSARGRISLCGINSLSQLQQIVRFW